MKKEKVLAAEELKAKIDEHDDFILVDLLPASDYHRAHIQGALNIPITELETKANQWLSHPIDIIVYSASLKCRGAEFAQDYLAKHGFRVWRLEGGLEEWIQKLYPLEGDPNYRPHDIVHNPFEPKAEIQEPAQKAKVIPLGVVRPGNIAEQPAPKKPQSQAKPIPKKKVA